VLLMIGPHLIVVRLIGLVNFVDPLLTQLEYFVVAGKQHG